MLETIGVRSATTPFRGIFNVQGLKGKLLNDLVLGQVRMAKKRNNNSWLPKPCMMTPVSVNTSVHDLVVERVEEHHVHTPHLQIQWIIAFVIITAGKKT